MDDIDPVEVGKRIRDLRVPAKIRSQEELARRVGVSLATVSRWENGHQLPQRELPALCDALGVTAEHLLRGLSYAVDQGASLTNRKWHHVLGTPSGQRLSRQQQVALMALVGDRDMPEWRVLAIIDLLLAGE